MTQPDRPLSFFRSFLKSVDQADSVIGISAIFPITLLGTVVLPLLIVIIFPNLTIEIDQQSFSAIMAAIMTVSGILAAVSVSAMVQIQQIVCTYPFSEYLEEEQLFDSFIFFPQFTFAIQCSTALICTISFIINALNDSFELELITLSAGMLIYTFLKTFGLVDLIRVLTWHYSKYLKELNKTE